VREDEFRRTILHLILLKEVLPPPLVQFMYRSLGLQAQAPGGIIDLPSVQPHLVQQDVLQEIRGEVQPLFGIG
jgi:hypothetical protein